MGNTCPLCGQPLPQAMTQIQLQQKMSELASPALAAERGRLKEEYEVKLLAEREIARQRAERQVQQELKEATRAAQKAREEKDEIVRKLQKEFQQRLLTAQETGKRDAERTFKGELAESKKRADAAEKRLAREVEEARREAERRVQKQMADEVRLATRENEARVDKIQAEREKERARHELSVAQLQGKLELLTRKLEMQSGERRGDEAEMDLFADLEAAFPRDNIKRVGKGVKGGDIIHEIVDTGNVVGRIVYESKNVSTWQNAFVVQAKRYQTQYDTQFVIIVSTAFPRKEKDLCIVNRIPVIRPRMAVTLASVMREGIVEIGRLRTSAGGRDSKVQQLFDYIIGDKFSTRFRDIAETVNDLRSHQQKERNWHANAWETQAKLHDRIEGSHRDIGAQIDTVIRTESRKRPLSIAASAGRR